jgi:short-subunit dehydrogenase
MTNPAAVSASRPVALITGASAGIGHEFALRLAERGYDLVLVARRRDRLEELAARVRVAYDGLRAQIVAADHADAAAPARIATEVASIGLTVDLLVNNAGFGTHGRFEQLESGREHEEIEVNVQALVALTHAFLPGMLGRGRGGVINVASTAAFMPVPYMAVYGATKAFVRSFSEALHEEVHTRGVRVIALCPGPTATEFFDLAVAAPRGPIRSVRDVVTTGLRAYDGAMPVAIDGVNNQLLIASSRLVPRRFATHITGRLMHP